MQTITEHTPPAGAPPSAEQQAAPLILRGITWQTYESLLADLGEQSDLRLTYDQGTLESTGCAHNLSLLRLTEPRLPKGKLNFYVFIT
jgi:hypothetical protein